MKSENMKVEKFVNYFVENFSRSQEQWNYEDGCVLLGLIKLDKAKDETKYDKVAIDYMENFIEEDGTIDTYEFDKFNIDNVNDGKVLLYLYELTKNEKYKTAFLKLVEQLEQHPRTNSNNFWHKNIYPNQIWLDGLYMAQPFYAEYETNYNQMKNYQDIRQQFLNVRKFMFDQKKKLYYHAYDESKIQPWANAETGLSENFWLRSMGWFIMALVDCIDVMSETIYEVRRDLIDLLKEAIDGLLLYQDQKTKLFYQVIDKPEEELNYLETSGSAMIAYTIMKACRLGILSSEKYYQRGIEIFNNLVDQKIYEENNQYHLKDICGVAGLGTGESRDGSVDYYLSEPIVDDDHKGVGAFIMAYAEYVQAE